MLLDFSTFDLNDPLLEATMEVFAIEEYYETLEKQIEHVQKSQKLKLDAYILREKLTPDDPEWHEAIQEYYHLVDFLLPRFFRGPFLVSLYALYESVVTEIANLAQARHRNLKRFSKYKGGQDLNFLERSRKYYAEILRIELCSDVSAWSRLVALLEFRHALAHSNGRIDLIRPAKKSVVLDLIRTLPDVDTYSGYITFGKDFVADTTCIVINELRRLIEDNRETCRIHKIV